VQIFLLCLRLHGRLSKYQEPATNEQARERELEKLLDLPYHESIQAWERLLLERALKQSNGNKAEAARMLGIHRRLLYEKLGSEGS
jgi:DNA-binding NtrC family response regulator